MVFYNKIMNYILYYSGEIPSYANQCIDAIKSVEPNSKIYFLGDKEFTNAKISFIDINDLKNKSLISKLDKLNYYKNQDNYLWKSSLYRLFYINSLIEDLSINKFIHFDLDVLIYKSFNEISHVFKPNKINITPGNESNIILGYCYVDGKKIFNELCNLILEIQNNSKYFEERYFNKHTLNDMELLNIACIEKPELFSLLKTVPNNDKLVFDANSYGQYIGGIPNKMFSKKFINPSHYSGRSMLKHGYKPEYNKGKPVIVFNKSNHEIVNLHIHKKSLIKYAPNV